VKKVTTILLAAGQAKRMGQLKQLLPLQSSTIMGVTLANIMASNTDEIIVVTGAMARNTGAIARKLGIKTVYNPRYCQGMSTSMAKGLEKVNPDSELIMIALADQPLIKPATYNMLMNHANKSEKGITIPFYRGKKGNPIVFHRRYLKELAGSTGDIGGRQLLKRNPEDILKLEVDDRGVIANINTAADYENLLQLFKEGSIQIAKEN